MRRMLASHPDFSEIDAHNRMLCVLLNPTVHFNTARTQDEIDPLLVPSIKSNIESGLDNLLDGGLFRDFVTSMEMT